MKLNILSICLGLRQWLKMLNLHFFLFKRLICLTTIVFFFVLFFSSNEFSIETLNDLFLRRETLHYFKINITFGFFKILIHIFNTLNNQTTKEKLREDESRTLLSSNSADIYHYSMYVRQKKQQCPTRLINCQSLIILLPTV